MDTRSWISMARVDEDPNAMVWNAQLGWLVDVTLMGGELDGEGPVNCRVGSFGQGTAAGEHHPPRLSALVGVFIPTGDPNEDAIIFCQLHDVETMMAPTVINELPINEAMALTTHIFAFPTEMLEQEYATIRMTAESMIFGTPTATEPFVRGLDLQSALGDFATAISEFAAAIVATTATPLDAALPHAPAVAAATPLIDAAAALQAAATQYLSTRILGD
jgi:hypothetical protein